MTSIATTPTAAPTPAGTNTTQALLDALNARNQAEAQDIQRIRLTNVPMELPTTSLLPKLRYAFPNQQTNVERILIPAMKTAFPELHAEFASYQQKPTGCGCAVKIQTTLAREAIKTQAVLDAVFGAGLYTHVPTTTAGPAALGSGRSLVGTTAVIDATGDAWSMYFAELTVVYARGVPSILQTLYKGVHVRDIEQGTKWLLLFY